MKVELIKNSCWSSPLNVWNTYAVIRASSTLCRVWFRSKLIHLAQILPSGCDSVFTVVETNTKPTQQCHALIRTLYGTRRRQRWYSWNRVYGNIIRWLIVSAQNGIIHISGQREDICCASARQQQTYYWHVALDEYNRQNHNWTQCVTRSFFFLYSYIVSISTSDWNDLPNKSKT